MALASFQRGINKAKKEITQVEKVNGAAYGYGRVSTEDQDTTCAPQKKGIEAFHSAMYSEYTWGGHFIDPAVSGMVPFEERPGGKALLERLQPGDIIIAAKYDRLSRDLADFARLLRRLTQMGCGIICLDMQINTLTNVGTLVAQILVAIAEFENKRRSERIKDSNNLKIELGQSLGKSITPLGFSPVPRGMALRPCLKEQLVMRQVSDWWNQGYTYAQIVKAYAQDPQFRFPRSDTPLERLKNYAPAFKRYRDNWIQIEGSLWDVTEGKYEYKEFPLKNEAKRRFMLKGFGVTHVLKKVERLKNTCLTHLQTDLANLQSESQTVPSDGSPPTGSDSSE